MEELINQIDRNLPPFFIKIAGYMHTTPAKILFATAIFILAILINLFMKKVLRRVIKYFLYKNRRVEFYRLLFNRIEKIGRPLRMMIVVFLIRKAIDIFVVTDMLDIIFFSLYWFFFFWLIYEIMKFFLYTALRAKIKKQKEARMELFGLFLNITKVVIAFLLIILILSKMGIDLTALITSLGIGGAIIGLSAKETLTNFFDSIRIVSEDAFRQGDWIETAEIEGFVVEMGLTSTKIRTFDNALVTVPNSVLANHYIKNWTRRMVGRRIKFHIRLKYSSDTKEIDRVVYEIHEMLHKHPDIVNENKLRYIQKMKLIYESGLFNIEDKYGVRRTLLVYLDELDKYSMNILIYAFSISVNWEEWLRVKQDVIKKIIQIVDESSLEFALPIQEILLENVDKIPQKKENIYD